MRNTVPVAVLLLGVKLGAHDEPTEEMKIRVKTAANVFMRLAENGRPCPIIVCGGVTEGHKLSEADVMEEILVLYGVPRDKIIKDVKSRNTMENMLFAISAANIKKGQKVCVITSDYHNFRAVMTAKRAGLDAYGAKARLKHDAIWLKALLKEMVYTIDLLFGWQDEKRKRPAFMECWIRQLSKW